MYRFLAGIIILSVGMAASAQHAIPKNAAKAEAPAKQLTPEQKFVIDTVKMAVALPQPDQQDRLRVLATAADVVSTIDKKMAKGFWNEGVRIESELVRLGQTPAVSMMANGQANCGAVQSFVENLPEASALKAEQALIGAVTMCKQQAIDPVSRKLDAALEKGIVPSRALMATMQAQGENSAWSQEHFAKMFAALPNPKENAAEAENLAAMYAQMSPQVEKEIAAKSGLQLLVWLGKLEDSPLRALSIHIASDAMQQTLGAEAYQKALESDVVAQSTVQNAGEIREIERPQEESVSILAAMDDKGDQSERLSGLPPSLRAREAAAHGFAAGTSGDKKQAGKYFDMAFSAADEVWEKRTPEIDVASVVQEISEAAAQVDSVNALVRAQKLRDNSAQAIAMLAVARVVASNGITK